MSKPKVFISSTYYDLKYVRENLEQFVRSLGFDVVLSEHGDVPYLPDMPLDESCYKQVENSDIFVLIIGGRTGSKRSHEESSTGQDFYHKYESITKAEYERAVSKDIPIYVLIEKSVYADFQTFLKNKSNETVNYAHADSVNVFILIESIKAQTSNNPIHEFDRSSEIEEWLRQQWAGLFRELLTQRSTKKQLSTLATEVSILREINSTLRTYLEKLVTVQLPENESALLIKTESKRLEETTEEAKILESSFGWWLKNYTRLSVEKLRILIMQSENISEFLERLEGLTNRQYVIELIDLLNNYSGAREELDLLRTAVGRGPFNIEIPLKYSHDEKY